MSSTNDENSEDAVVLVCDATSLDNPILASSRRLDDFVFSSRWIPEDLTAIEDDY